MIVSPNDTAKSAKLLTFASNSPPNNHQLTKVIGIVIGPHQSSIAVSSRPFTMWDLVEDIRCCVPVKLVAAAS